MPRAHQQSLHATAASHALPSRPSLHALRFPDGLFVSTDDVATAHSWRALCTMRCSQLGLTLDSDALTTCSRACNVRRRLDPPLPPGYCGNAALQVWTTMSVAELLGTRLSDVARALRASLLAETAETLAERGRWLKSAQARGHRTRQAFDAEGLTFVMSSWGCDWEAAVFGGGAGEGAHAPIAFDHGAITPIVATLIRRPGGDGVNVYATGPHDSLEVFAKCMMLDGAGPGAHTV